MKRVGNCLALAGSAGLLAGCDSVQETVEIFGAAAISIFLLTVLATPPVLNWLQRREHRRRMYKRRPFSDKPRDSKR